MHFLQNQKIKNPAADCVDNGLLTLHAEKNWSLIRFRHQNPSYAESSLIMKLDDVLSWYSLQGLQNLSFSNGKWSNYRFFGKMYRFKGISSTCLQKLNASTGIGIVHLGPQISP